MNVIDTNVWIYSHDTREPTKQLLAQSALSFWDALLVGACVHAGVTALYTEDMGAPRRIDGLTLINPFLATTSPGPNG